MAIPTAATTATATQPRAEFRLGEGVAAQSRPTPQPNSSFLWTRASREVEPAYQTINQPAPPAQSDENYDDAKPLSLASSWEDGAAYDDVRTGLVCARPAVVVEEGGVGEEEASSWLYDDIGSVEAGAGLYESIAGSLLNLAAGRGESQQFSRSAGPSETSDEWVDIDTGELSVSVSGEG